MTLLHLVTAALMFLFGSGANVLLPNEGAPFTIPTPEIADGAAGPEGQLMSATAGDQLLDPSLLTGDADALAPAVVVSAAQVESEEPLDDGPEADGEVLDAPTQEIEVEVSAEPLDAPLTEVDEVLDAPIAAEEVLDAPVEDVEVLDAPRDEPVAERPVEELEPLDAPIVAEVVDQPIAEVEPLDDGVAPGQVVAAPVKKPAPQPLAKPAPVVAKTKAAPPVAHGKPVTSVRTKGFLDSQVVVTAGRDTFPVEYADCAVAVAAGRATVGSDCGEEAVAVAHQPAIPRSPGSAALISTDDSSRITSRRDGVQIGAYPEPTLGDSIATTVRAAIFPEDVVVPEVLIVPGEVTVAGNDAREDPIVLWRSELEAAATATGMPVEVLATAIRVTSNGAVESRSATGGVGLMFVPVEELEERGVDPGDWFDPATNIRVGAEVLAEIATSSNAHAEAALASYVEESCALADACMPHDAAAMRDWIMHYRLRATRVVTDDTVAVANPMSDPDWPFSNYTNVEEEEAFDPFARTGSPFERDEAEDEDDDWPEPDLRHLRDRDDPNSVEPPLRVPGNHD